MLETSVQSVNSALQRARKTVDDKLPEESQQETLRSIGDDGLKEVVDGYMKAMEAGDVDAVIGLLAEDAVWSMPPLPAWFTGDTLRDFMTFGPLSGEWKWKHVVGHANGQAAIGSYAWYEPDQTYRPFALDVLTLDGKKIKAITSFINRSTDSRNPDDYTRFPEQPPEDDLIVFQRFGLPDRID
jgi:RNA polymerase sigma-70 factor (ECF subfamily)